MTVWLRLQQILQVMEGNQAICAEAACFKVLQMTNLPTRDGNSPDLWYGKSYETKASVSVVEDCTVPGEVCTAASPRPSPNHVNIVLLQRSEYHHDSIFPSKLEDSWMRSQHFNNLQRTGEGGCKWLEGHMTQALVGPTKLNSSHPSYCDLSLQIQLASAKQLT